MAKFIVNDNNFGCSIEGSFDSLAEAKKHLFQAVDYDVEDCQIVSNYEIIELAEEGDLDRTMFEFVRDNTPFLTIERLKARIRYLVNDEGSKNIGSSLDNPYTMQYIAQLCKILADKLGK